MLTDELEFVYFNVHDSVDALFVAGWMYTNLGKSWLSSHVDDCFFA